MYISASIHSYDIMVDVFSLLISAGFLFLAFKFHHLEKKKNYYYSGLIENTFIS